MLTIALSLFLVQDQTWSGNLEASDPTLTQGEYYDSMTFNGTAGQRVVITMSSDDFDTYVAIMGPNDFTQENDDIGQGNTNSRLELTLPADGEYSIVATSYQGGETGMYTITLSGATSAGPGDTQQGPATGGQEWTGALEQGDPTLQSGEFADQYTFQGTAGDEFTITLMGEDFDPYLGLTGPNDYQSANDDAPGLGLNSRISGTLPATGEYTIQVTSYSAGMTGAYTLTLEIGAAAGGTTAPADGSIVAGTPIQSALDGSEETISTGEYTDEYIYTGVSGEVITVTLRSTEYDPYLMIRGPEEFSEDNDDSEGTNSMIEATLPVTGEYRIIVTSYQPGETGAYTVELTSSGGAAPNTNPTAGAQSLTPGTPVNGSLAGTDPRRDSGQPYRAFTFNGSADSRVVIDLTSDAFDTYLILRGPGGFEENDDDSGDELNSRLDTVLPANGTYEVWASAYGDTAAGAFTLSVTLSGGGTGDATTAPAEGALTLGTHAEGSLATGDDTLDSGEFVDRFTLRAPASGGVTILVESDDFDTYLIVNGPGMEQQDNDDGPMIGTNSRLDLTLTPNSEYSILVSSYRPGMTGSYRVSALDPSDAPLSAMRGMVYGVFAGITDYGGAGDLEYCAEDAVKLHAAIAQTGLLAPQSVLLTDAEVTPANVRAAFEAVAAAAGPDDVFIFFYSGHGGQTGSNVAGEPDGRNETISLRGGDITDDEMAEWFGQVRSRVALIALDSCHAGGFARDVITSPNRMGVFSSEEDVLSLVASNFQAGGYLSYFLRTGMAGEADNEPADGVISVGELTQYLRRQWAENVDASTTTSEGAQTYQNLVIERGGVKVTEGLLRLNNQ